LVLVIETWLTMWLAHLFKQITNAMAYHDEVGFYAVLRMILFFVLRLPALELHPAGAQRSLRLGVEAQDHRTPHVEVHQQWAGLLQDEVGCPGHRQPGPAHRPGRRGVHSECRRRADDLGQLDNADGRHVRRPHFDLDQPVPILVFGVPLLDSALPEGLRQPPHAAHPRSLGAGGDLSVFPHPHPRACRVHCLLPRG